MGLHDAFFLAVPLAALLPEAFGDGGSAFARLFGNPLFLGALRNTLALGLAAGAVSALVGTCIAIDWHDRSHRGASG